ncbi:hypothetical protein [Variovorax sp. YR216]|uniref:hypothetical protein n=1 Tax=Variovorax sp. YR216 TaxID=1882828 RepID=UPI00115FBF88|nr:hypothetical protein [Variovorax sp. YR216]
MSRNLGWPAVLGIALMPAASWWSMSHRQPLWGWFAVAVLLLVFAAVTGRAVTGFWRGLLIDQRNVISLARFQMAIWTVIVLSAFLTAAMYNVFTGVDEPLSIQVPSHLWWLMGMSTTSLIGTPLLLGDKARKAPSQAALDATKALLQKNGEQYEDTHPVGQVLANTAPESARWSDMLTGDETSNGAHLDLAKLQMFFFTLVIAMTYVAALWRTFVHAQPDGITQFPLMNDSTIALLGISHAGYLANKAVPRQ